MQMRNRDKDEGGRKGIEKWGWGNGEMGMSNGNGEWGWESGDGRNGCRRMGIRIGEKKWE